MADAYMDNQLSICLNPYYAGRWFLLILSLIFNSSLTTRLNPYYAGRWFLLIN